MLFYLIFLNYWPLNYNYATLRIFCFISQINVYEVEIIIIFINLIFIINSLTLNNFYIYQINIKFFILLILLFIRGLVEIHLSLFNYSKAESELVLVI